jgi:hypothetical protein
MAKKRAACCDIDSCGEKLGGAKAVNDIAIIEEFVLV